MSQSIFGLGKKKQITFKPHKNIPQGTKQYELSKYAEATLGSGDVKLAVALPEGEDLREWLAVHTVDFFNQVNMLYGTIMNFCTPSECPVMSAGAKYEYMWADGVIHKTAVKCSAPEYVDYLMCWIQEQLDDEEVFPSRVGAPFPRNYEDCVKNMFKRLFRVYAHIYHSHFQQVVSLEEEAHLNTSFKHFIFFVKEFELVGDKELAPMSELIASFMSRYENEFGSGTESGA